MERNLKKVLNTLDEKFVKKCDFFNCCHYGEGCALGYPIGKNGELSNEEVVDIKMLYSAEFKEYWEKKLHRIRWDKNNNVEILPCSHQGCSFSGCRHLDNVNFMSNSYKKWRNLD